MRRSAAARRSGRAGWRAALPLPAADTGPPLLQGLGIAEQGSSLIVCLLLSSADRASLNCGWRQIEALTDALEEANAGTNADKETRRMLDEVRRGLWVPEHHWRELHAGMGPVRARRCGTCWVRCGMGWQAGIGTW